MMRRLHQDPDRRCRPLGEWPHIDRHLWLTGLVPGDLFEERGARAKFTENTNRGVVEGYGRWLQWLDRHGLLDQTNSPADRITPDRVRAYLADLERHNATQTVLNRLVRRLHLHLARCLPTHSRKETPQISPDLYPGRSLPPLGS
jgi:hypothetical protein